MNALSDLRQMAVFFRRDLTIARSYRSAFVLEFLEIFFGVASFYYLSRFVESESLSRALPAGSTYFDFALVGIAFFDYLSAALSAFDSALEEAWRNRTLEVLLVTQASVPVILAGSAIYPFALMALRTAVYLGWGIAVFRFPLHAANWAGAVVVLSVSVLAFTGMGVISAAYQLLFKRGNPAKWLFLGISGLLGGTMYPIAVLPHSLQTLARLIPITYSLEGMRAALLEGASLGQLWPAVRALIIFALVLLPVSWLLFVWALKRTKITGTLTHF